MVERTSSYHLQPKGAEVIGDQLAILWNDQTESFIPLEKLRCACPCARCGGEPNILGQVIRPEVTFSPQSFLLKEIRWVGGYALQPIWQDGHDSGLFTYPFLRQLHH